MLFAFFHADDVAYAALRYDYAAAMPRARAI